MGPRRDRPRPGRHGRPRVGDSEKAAYEHRQIPATRERVPRAEILTYRGGHLTTSEHPDLLAAAIRDVAERHGAATRRRQPATPAGNT